MIYIIDHQDSFTWNVVHQFSKFGKVYCSNYFDINKRLLDKSKIIVLSPGPGSPKDYPSTSEIYKKYKGKKKILGICLGFQQIVFAEGGKIVKQKKIYHGFQSRIRVLNNSSIFKSRHEYLAGRYHSLKIAEPIKSKTLKITMRCCKTNVAMGIEDEINKVYGFQFHPDSFLTPNGKNLIKKIIST